MKIISKFKDYYDSAMGYGVDKTVIYNRYTKEVTLPNHPLSSIFRDFEARLRNSGNGLGTLVISPAIVLFCGQAYPLLYQSNYLYSRFDQNKSNSSPHVFYDFGEYMEFLRAQDIERYNTNMKAKSGRNQYFCFWMLTEYDVFEGMRKFAESFNNDLHFDYASPVMVIKGKGGRYRDNKIILEINPVLKDYAFYKEFPPFQAFQEIDMFISGVLGTGAPETVEISDKEMAIKKGHDGKYSFRKRPEK